MRLTLLPLVAVGLLGCGDDPTSLQMQLLYAQDTCGDTPVNNAFFALAGTVGVHVIGAGANPDVIASDCLELPEETFRALPDLPRLFDEQLALPPLPEEGAVRVQIDIYDAVATCTPYRDGVLPIPKYLGLSPELFLDRPPDRIEVSLRCL